MIDDERLIYMRMKNGDTMMGVVEEEGEVDYIITAAMNIVIVERAEYAGMSMTPVIPFGIDQQIQIMKTDILFSVEPPEVLVEIYSERAEDAVEALIEYLQLQDQRKKNREKLMH